MLVNYFSIFGGTKKCNQTWGTHNLYPVMRYKLPTDE